MTETLVLNTALSAISLLLVATMVSFALRKSQFPYTVSLVLVGLGVGFLSQEISSLAFLQDFRLSPELVFYVFLPTLIFESAFHIQIKHFKQSAATILSLSTVGMLMSTGLVALGMHYLIDLPWTISLLFGALISATDPISVLALFKKIGAPKRLSTIVEGESLFNDAAALVLFGLLIEQQSRGIIGSFENFAYVVIAGILVGTVLGFTFSKALDYVRNSKEIEISITLILAHATFIIAEYFFGASGILATVMAGLIIGNYGAFKISKNVKEIMEHFWDYSAFLANSILFLMVGLIIYETKDAIWPLFLPILAVIGITLVARMVMVYTIMPIINWVVPKERVSLAWMHLIQWSGLRGALAMALILSLPQDFPYLDELLIYTVGVIFFTITFNGLTISPLLSLFKLKKLSVLEYFEYQENQIFIDKKVNAKLKHMHEKQFISERVYEEVDRLYSQQCDHSIADVKQLIESKTLSKKQLSTVLRRHLLGIERRVFTKLFYNGEITQELLGILVSNIERQLEKVDAQEKTELGRLTLLTPDSLLVRTLEKLGKKGLNERIKQRKVMLRYEMFRARVIAIEKVLITLKEIQSTQPYLDDALIKEHEDRYKEWRKKAKQKLKALQNQDPETCERVQTLLARRAAFQTEEKVIKMLHELGMNSSKVHQELIQNLEERENRVCL